MNIFHNIATAICIILTLAALAITIYAAHYAATQQMLARSLSRVVEMQTHRINGLVELANTLEERGNLLEEANRKNLYAAVMVLPVMSGTEVMARVTEISLN